MFDCQHGGVDVHTVSRDGSTTLAWGDGEYRFRLAYGQLSALEEACGDIGAPLIAEALSTRSFKVKYVRETIRLGLIGGGMSQSEALAAVRKFVEGTDNPADYFENALIGYAIIYAALSPPKDEAALKKAAGARKTTAARAPMDASTSAASTPLA